MHVFAAITKVLIGAPKVLSMCLRTDRQARVVVKTKDREGVKHETTTHTAVRHAKPNTRDHRKQRTEQMGEVFARDL